MPRLNLHPCSLCLVPNPKSSLDPHGVCIRCVDSKEEFILESIREGLDKERYQETSWEQIEASIKASAKAREAALRRREEEERIQAELKKRDEADAELASRALARRSLLHYVERRVPGYKAGWVHEDIARRIEEFVEKVERGESPRLILQVAPRAGKSELASISGPAWILGRHPDWTVLLTSYSDELPISWSRSIREQLKSDEFKTLFPSGGVVSKIDAGAKAWSTEQGGGVRASGVGGSILGFGAQIVVVDDPIKGAEEADSPGLLEKNWDWATSALYSRLMPGGGLIIIQQRWSNEDLVGRFISQMEAELQEIEDLRASAAELRAKPNADDLDLQEASNYEREAQELEDSMDRWDVVTYPALAEKDEYLSPEGEIIRFSPYEEVPTNYKPLRKTGEALHPERFGRNYFLKIKRANPRRFAALYQQTPIVDEGQYFAAGDLKRYSWRELPAVQFMNKFCAWDLAIGTKQSNDYTVGLVGAFDHEGRLWLLERIRGRFGDLEKVADMVMDLHLKHDAIITGIERTHLEMALHPILKRKMREQNKFILLAEGKDALKPISDKFVRARQLQALAKAGMVYVPDDDSWNEFVQELIRFGSTKTDDQVDAAAWLTIMAAKYSLPDNPSGTSKVEKSWYEEFMDEYLTNASEGKTFMAS